MMDEGGSHPAAVAYGLLGLPVPARAQEAASVAGGTLRMNMETRRRKDPCLWGWSELANFGRGWPDGMVEYEQDGSIRPMLLESWEASPDPKVGTQKIPPGVKWNNGDDFTAEDVLFDSRRWCDGNVEGSSMASGSGGLADPATKQMREESAAESGEIGATYQTTGDFIDICDSLGWVKSEALTAATIAVRFNQAATCDAVAAQCRDAGINVKRTVLPGSFI